MPPPQRPLFALGLRLLAAMLIATLLMLVKLAGEMGVSLAETLFWRQAVTAPSIIVYLALTGGLSRLRTERTWAHGRRSAVGMTNMVCNFFGVMLLPLAEAITLGFTAPVFAVIISALILREQVGKWRWLAVALGFAGVVIIARPGGGAIPAFGATVALTSALLVAVINHQIRDLGKTEEPISSVFWFSVFGTPLAALALPFFATSHNLEQWLVLLSIGAIGTIAQLLLNASLRYGAVSSVIVMDYSALVWATLYGWLIWEHLPPSTSWLGAPVIIAAGLLITWREHRLARTPSPKSTAEAD